MDSVFWLLCSSCGRRFVPSVVASFCDVCETPLDLGYKVLPNGSMPLLPLNDLAGRVYLGEENTPIVETHRLSSLINMSGSLFCKLEFMQPTGSFKDRGSSVMVSAVVEQEIGEFVEDSSGNAGASIAAYSAKAGIKVHVFVPSSTSQGKLDQIKVFKACLHKVDGPRQNATHQAKLFARERKIPYISHAISPYFIEGMKSVAFEITSSRLDVKHLVLPVGNGALLLGLSRGLSELLVSGQLHTSPRVHAVQSDSVRPLQAKLTGEHWDPEGAKPTVALGIASSRPPRLAQMALAVETRGGTCVTISDKSILEWQKRAAVSEGIFCEPTAAAAFAGLETLLSKGIVRPDEPTMVLITGSGLKEPLRH